MVARRGVEDSGDRLRPLIADPAVGVARTGHGTPRSSDGHGISVDAPGCPSGGSEGGDEARSGLVPASSSDQESPAMTRNMTQIVLVTVFVASVTTRPCLSALADLVTFEATIKAVDAKARRITVTRPGGKALDLEIGKGAKVSIGGREASLEALRVGSEASITYEPRLEIVTRIEVGVGGQAGEVRRLEGH